MKKSTFLLPLIGSILFFSSTFNAQDLQLTSGKKTKTIKTGTFIELSISSPDQEPCNKCPAKGVRGQLISYENGVVNLKVHQFKEPLVEEKNITGNIIKNYKKEYLPTVSFRTENILSVTKKGMKRIKKYTPVQSVGMVLTLIGFGHLVSAPVVSDTDTPAANRLLAVGVAELVTGIILGRVFQQNVYYTSESCPEKKPGQKIWVLK